MNIEITGNGTVLLPTRERRRGWEAYKPKIWNGGVSINEGGDSDLIAANMTITWPSGIFRWSFYMAVCVLGWWGRIYIGA